MEDDEMECDEVPLKKICVRESQWNINDNAVDIPWPLLHPKPQRQDEIDMEKFLVSHRYEKGRSFELPTERQEIIEKEAYDRGFLLTGAYSLRRQLIRKMTRGSASFFDSRNMGDATEANYHAENFERLTEAYIRENISIQDKNDSINILTETDLKAMKVSMTPDFLFPDGNVRINGSIVKWIDCKTYYGASSLVNIPYLPVGKLKQQCDKYVNAYGPGAIVFLNGFSQDLMEHIGMSPEHILFLDSNPLDTSTILGIEKHSTMIHKEELHCPHHKVGILIGKQGRTINRLIESTGCNIDIYHEYEKVVITASNSVQLQMGYEKVQNVLATRPLQKVEFLCPVRRVNRVIGKNGTIVRELMKRSDCVIKTSKLDVSPDGHSQIIYVYGSTQERIKVALALINDAIAS